MKKNGVHPYIRTFSLHTSKAMGHMKKNGVHPYIRTFSLHTSKAMIVVKREPKFEVNKVYVHQITF